jgi:hypothetical protein
MIVDEITEHYLIHSMGLSKLQIKKLLPSEVEDHCKKVIRNRIDETGINETVNDEKSKRS